MDRTCRAETQRNAALTLIGRFLKTFSQIRPQSHHGSWSDRTDCTSHIWCLHSVLSQLGLPSYHTGERSAVATQLWDLFIYLGITSLASSCAARHRT